MSQYSELISITAFCMHHVSTATNEPKLVENLGFLYCFFLTPTSQKIKILLKVLEQNHALTCIMLIFVEIRLTFCL